MVKMSAKYSGGLHCELVHELSQSRIETDAPKDNMGKGENFSPTDLMGAALASCILTTLAILAERDGQSLLGATAEVQKIMNPQPRRIKALPVLLRLPAKLPADYRKKLEQAARTCPVAISLHPDIEVVIEFSYL